MVITESQVVPDQGRTAAFALWLETLDRDNREVRLFQWAGRSLPTDRMDDRG